jgi:hypothetical protein
MVRGLMADYLRASTTRQCADVFAFLSSVRLFGPPVLDPQLLDAIAAHMLEICQDWRWP